MNAFVKNTWYYAAWTKDLKDKPLYRKICGDHVALYRTQSGEVRAIGAVCPHRGANLAEGEVIGESLRCPYHGWKFSADGKCDDIPAQPDSVEIQANACVPTYAIREQQGIIWIWLGQNKQPDVEPTHYPMLDDDRLGVAAFGPAFLEAQFINVVENAFDESHLCFIHQRTIGMKTPLVPQQLMSKDEDGLGVTARWDPETPWGQELFKRKGDFKPKRSWLDDITALALFAGSRKLPDWTKRRWGFRMGGTVSYREFDKDGDPIMMVLGLAAPVDENTTMFATAFVNRSAKSWLGRLAINRMGPMLNAEDTMGTEGLLLKANELEHPVSVVSDRATMAFRRLYGAALASEQDATPDSSEEPAAKLTKVA